MSLAKELEKSGWKPSDTPHTPMSNPQKQIKHSVSDYLQAIDKAVKTGTTKTDSQPVKVEVFLV